MKTKTKMRRMTSDYGILFHHGVWMSLTVIIAGVSNLSCGEYRKGRES